MPSLITNATKREIDLGHGRNGAIYSLPALEKELGATLSRLPISIRVVLESLLRNCDGRVVQEDNVRELASWQPKASSCSRCQPGSPPSTWRSWAGQW